MFSIFQLDFPPNHISYLFPPVQLHVLICHFPSANFPLSFAQSTTFLCPICHFHFQHFSTGFLFESYFIFVSPSNCMCPIFTNYFQVLQYPGAQTTACKAQHSQGCNVFYKIVNCHLCWKAFSPRHLHFGGCCTLESWSTSSRNSCQSEVADILQKIQTAQWPEPCRESAMQGNGCWEGAKKDW